jgi:hypothetical protein
VLILASRLVRSRPDTQAAGAARDPEVWAAMKEMLEETELPETIDDGRAFLCRSFRSVTGVRRDKACRTGPRWSDGPRRHVRRVGRPQACGSPLSCRCSKSAFGVGCNSDRPAGLWISVRAL